MRAVPVIKFGKAVFAETKPPPAPPPPKRASSPLDRDLPRCTKFAADAVGVMRAVTDAGIAYTHEADHRGATFFGTDMRSTSSSRKPGKAIEGKVDHSNGQRLVTCAACGVKRLGEGGPHAAVVAGHDLVRDCRGKLWLKRLGVYVRSDS